VHLDEETTRLAAVWPLAQSMLEVFSPNCRVDLGDHRYKVPDPAAVR
jgi:hypothetical protein